MALGWAGFWLLIFSRCSRERSPRLPASAGKLLAGHEPTASLLRWPPHSGRLLGMPLNRMLRVGFGWFDRAFHFATGLYTRGVGGLLRVSVLVLLVYCGLLGLTWWRFVKTPKGFIPAQDMGYLMVNIQLPDSASMERTQEVVDRIVRIATANPGVKHCSGISGQSFVLNAFGSNFGSMFVNLREYHLRRDPSLSSDSIANYLRTEFGKQIVGATCKSFLRHRFAAWGAPAAS